MNVADLTETELREKANGCMKDFEAVSPLEKQDRVAEAQFYLAEIERRDQVAERKHSRLIETRDLILEVVIIALISWEIYSAKVEGKSQLDVLSKLQASSAATAETLKDVQKAQEATTKAIQPQVALLERTRDTLATQLDVAKRQQDLISQQLTLQENAIAEKRRAPIMQLRVFTRTKKVPGGEYRLIKPGPSSYLGYAPRPLDDPRLHEIRLTFLLRDVGTAPILNLSRPNIRVPNSAFTVKCVDFSSETHLFGELPEECSAPVDKFPPIEPVPRETPVPTQPAGGSPDFVFQVLVVGPVTTPQFDISVELSADNLQPIYYRIQCMRLSDMSPSAE